MRQIAPHGRRLGVLLGWLSLLSLAPARAQAGQLGFVYAMRQEQTGGQNQLYGYRLNALTGALTAIGGFPIGSGGTGSSQVSNLIAYGGGRLFVLNMGDNTLGVFAVNRGTGALQAMPYSPVSLGSGFWSALFVHPSGSPVIVVNSTVDTSIASFL